MTTAVIGAAVLVIGCDSGSATTPKPPSPSALVVFTTWVPDPKVTGGPQPGYKPAFTGLTGRDIQSALPIVDSTGTAWFVNVSFTQRGANLFAKLTRDNVAACPGDCAQRHLAIWLDLSQADIDNWEDPTFAARVSLPYDLGCRMHQSSTTPCQKFVSNPITLQQVSGGSAPIGCGCTQKRASELAAAINSTSRRITPA
jgi:preprotein translocase subunit SecD